MYSVSADYIILTLLFSCLIPSYGSSEPSLNAEEILKTMETAYARVQDYQTDVEVNIHKGDGSVETQKFLYTFKKPKRIRLDFKSPHSGMVLVYPDRSGKVGVRPGGIARVFQLHLSSGDPLITGASGQRIDQTDFGLLIKKISRSLTDQLRGPAEIEQNGYIRIRVLASNHFRQGVVTALPFLH